MSLIACGGKYITIGSTTLLIWSCKKEISWGECLTKPIKIDLAGWLATDWIMMAAIIFVKIVDSLRYDSDQKKPFTPPQHENIAQSILYCVRSMAKGLLLSELIECWMRTNCPDLNDSDIFVWIWSNNMWKSLWKLFLCWNMDWKWMFKGGSQYFRVCIWVPILIRELLTGILTGIWVMSWLSEQCKLMDWDAKLIIC